MSVAVYNWVKRETQGPIPAPRWVKTKVFKIIYISVIYILISKSFKSIVSNWFVFPISQY